MERRPARSLSHNFRPAFMTRYVLSALPILLAGLLLAAGSGPAPVAYTFRSSPNSMSVEGGSTVHDWSCPIKTLGGTLRMDTTQTSAAPRFSRVQVAVPVDAIQCDNGTMNEKLREALQMNAYPEVYFSLEDAEVSALPDSGKAWFAVDATGEITLAGERKQVDLPVKGKRLSDGDVRFVGSHTIRLSDYDIERPSAMFGAIKTSKEVTVNFDVTATPETSK